MLTPHSSLPITQLSPALSERLLACPSRVAFEQSRGPSFGAPPSGPALVGVAAHRAIQLCLGDPPLSPLDGWQRACEELHDRGVDPREEVGARRASLRLERRLPELRRYIASRGPGKLLLEHELAAPNEGLLGRPDLIIVAEHPSVVDYKSGLVKAANDEPRAAYRRQLAMYAWLARAALGVDVRDAALFSLREGIVEVRVEPEAQDAVIASGITARSIFNERVPGRQPAIPSDESCRWCPFVGRCDAVWRAIGEGKVTAHGVGDAGRGRVAAPVLVSANGSAAVPLDVTTGTVSGPMMLIDIPAAEANGLQVGDRVAAWGLVKRSDDPLTLAWREQSSAMEKLSAVRPPSSAAPDNG